ncbi:MAG: DUF1987 domain-containing protein [Lachnospiraceae bacterium]|nr:DUF1987 domain-containing protein [Lachnospiraceae bacterium]
MNDLIIEKTLSTPDINFSFASRKLNVEGESFPENAVKFYEPIINWIEEYFMTVGDEETEINFEIIYFNSSTSKIYMMIFSMLDELVQDGKKITVNWRVSRENETAIECGEEFMEDLEFVDFKIEYIGE